MIFFTQLYSSLMLYGVTDVDAWFEVELNLAVSEEIDIDIQVNISSSHEETIDEEIKIQTSETIDVDHQAGIWGSYGVDVDHQVKNTRPVANVASFLVYEVEEEEIHDYTDDIGAIGLIRRYLDKSFGICQVSDVSVVCENEDQKHTFLSPEWDFESTSKYIWTWAKIICGWGAQLDQNVQAQFQGLVETLELTEGRECNFVLVDVLRELLDGRLAEPVTFNQDLVDSTSLESLNPIHIVRYLIEDILGIQVLDFDTKTLVDACDGESFDEAYLECSGTTVNDTTWSADSGIIEMIQDALKLVQGWIYTGGNGRIKTQIFPSIEPPEDAKHFIGSETRDNRKVMKLRLHPTRRNVRNYITWTYGQGGLEFGPTQSVESIAKYGYRPLELSTKWEVDVGLLMYISSALIFRYKEPPNMITFTTSNLYGTGDGLDAELGEIIKITDDGVGIDGLYFRITEKSDDLLGRKTQIVAEEYRAY